jgi:uncharacterized repeat protein (TIGR01451 family)
VGKTITYTLAVFNAGPGVAQNVHVTDTPPAGVTIESVSTTQGTCAGLTCEIGSIPADENETMTVVAHTTAVGSVTNSGSATATNDTSPGNNASSVTATVVAAPPPPPEGQNHAPTAVSDTTAVFVGAVRSLDVVRNDVDPDSDRLNVVSFTQGNFGRVACSVGTCGYLSRTRTGKDTFSYTIADGHGATSTATVSVTIGRERGITKHLVAKGCKPVKKKKKSKKKAKKRCARPVLPRTLQLTTMRAPWGLLPTASRLFPFESQRGWRCRFTRTGDPRLRLGQIEVAGWQRENGKTGTNIMMERFRLIVWQSRALGLAKPEPIARDHVNWWWTYPNDERSFFTPNDYRYRPPHVPVWVFPFNGLYEGQRVALQTNFQWRKSYLWSHKLNWRASRLIYETGWQTACAGEPTNPENLP